MTLPRCMSDAPVGFKRQREDSNATRYDRYHSRARSPEKDRGDDSPPWLTPIPSLASTISVTPEEPPLRGSRVRVDALGDPDTHPCPSTNTPEVTA